MRPSRQTMPKPVVSESLRIIEAWDCLRTSDEMPGRNEGTKLLLNSIRIVQALSPSDTCLVTVAFRDSGLSRAESGIDSELVETFAELLERLLRLNCESLCLVELCSFHADLFRVSVQDRAFVPYRDRVASALVTRVREQERLPDSFPVLSFLDTFMQDVDEKILENLSKWFLEQTSRAPMQTKDLDPVLVDTALEIQRCYDTLKVHQSDQFIRAVRRLVS